MVTPRPASLAPSPKCGPADGESAADDHSQGALPTCARQDLCPAATLDEHLHYRLIDVSSIKELCRRWYPRTYFGQPPKQMNHRALADITAPLIRNGVVATWILIFIGSIRELSATILLFTARTKTVSVTMFDLRESNDWGPIAVLSVSMLVITFVIVALASTCLMRWPPSL